MKIAIQKLPKSEILITIKVPAKELASFFDEAILNLGKNLEIEGFRKGRVPKEIIEREIGQEKILREAGELAIKENYLKTILENKIEPISQPEIEILKLAPGNPLEFKARVPVLPEIQLPDYKKIAFQIKKREVFVEKKEIEESLKWLQKSRAKFTIKNEPCQKGDFIEIEYWSPQIESGKKIKDAFILGQGHLISGFEENLEGMKNNEEKEFSFVFPKNYSRKNLAGEKVNFKVKMDSVQRVEFPEINDQFAKNLGQFENLVALKKSLKEGINLEKENQERQRVRQEILEKIVQNSEFEIPEILIESEKSKMVEGLKQNLSQRLGISFEDYLNKIKKSEKEISEEFLAEAQKRVKNSLVLREISKRENIEVSPEEVKEEVNKILKKYPNIEKAKGLDLERLKEYTEGVIRNEKTFQLLEGLAKNHVLNSNCH